MAAIGIIGVGLIGGSVASGVRSAALYDEIIGFDESPAALEQARAQGLIDRAAADIESVARDSALVLIAVPTRSIGGCLQALARSPGLNRLVVSDTGSVKGAVVAAAAEVFGKLPAGFVPGHPIAGSEQSGPQAADGALFRGAKVILTPTPATSARALGQVDALWRGLGAEVRQMSAQDHDRLLAMTSHLPHMLAYALIDMLASEPEAEAIFDLAGGGFRDFTRIASSDPRMWHDIFMDNAEALTHALDLFETRLVKLRGLVQALRSEDLLALCERAKRVRDQHLSRG